jgi:hypothetical protein
MKTLLTLLLTCFGITIFGSDTTLFRDEDTGFVMQIPTGVKRTWNLSHSENGIELVVFQNEEDFSFIAFGKLPLTDVLGEGSEGLYPFVFEEMQELFGDEESAITLEVLPSLADQEYAASRIRIRLEDEEEGVCLDLHSFLVDTNSIHIATGVYARPESELDQFTYDVLSTVFIIEEEGQ